MRDSLDSVNTKGFVHSPNIYEMEIISDLYPSFYNIKDAVFVSNNIPDGYVEILK